MQDALYSPLARLERKRIALDALRGAWRRERQNFSRLNSPDNMAYFRAYRERCEAVEWCKAVGCLKDDIEAILAEHE